MANGEVVYVTEETVYELSPEDLGRVLSGEVEILDVSSITTTWKVDS